MSVNLASRILSDFRPIPAFYAKVPAPYADIYLFHFPCAGNICGRVLSGRIRQIANYVCGREGGGQGNVGGKKNVWVCTQNYSGTQFIAPSLGLILNPSSAPGPSGDWEGELRKSCGIKTLPPRLWSVRQPIHVCVKWVSQVFLPWVDSNSILWLEPPSRSCYPLRGNTEKNVSIAHNTDFCDFPSFPSPNESGDYPLSHTCRYPCHNLQIWSLWWHKSGFPMSLRWEHHFLYPFRPSPDLPPSLIYCSPGGWDVLRVHMKLGRII